MLDFLQTPFHYQTVIAILGLLVGSFLNVVIARVPKKYIFQQYNQDNQNNMEIVSLWSPASHCPHCQQAISPLDNIPLLSYCFLKGRCRHCRVPISLRYPMVELFTCLFSVLVAIRFGWTIQTLAALLLTWGLIALSFIDLEWMILPDSITLPFTWMGLGLSLFSIFQTPSDAILGAMIGYFSLWIIFWIFKVITKKEGMGYGDFKLTALLGAWLGWLDLPFIIFIASSLACLRGLYLILFKKMNKNDPIPFGPYLAFAGWVVLMMSNNLKVLYSRIIF